MKVIFVGPSLPDAPSLAGPDIKVRPPAVQGDVMAAVAEGASAIGLIDGGFEYAAPVWHKEILHGLAHGVEVLGGASMGALRAAECHSFGMIGIGRIFEDYCTGAIIDDADVALLHAPAEMKYLPLTVPMVNVTATLMRLAANGLITRLEAQEIERSARLLFFKERIWRNVIANAHGIGRLRSAEIQKLLGVHHVDQKRLDAVMLVDHLRNLEPMRAVHKTWALHATSFWRERFELSSE